ncbi:hypothetical protein [Ktedonobacter sp. SOSP1-52]|uniref:hypothetical protein n=1 Tax=Ktedonobacter sp. SOSP1-52 TaxID=2778366 RepID=UPI001F2F7D7F|nr:hypothetical protein [Ktedonobacter sp. SOSP1-52]
MSTPIDRDEGKEPMLNLVPFAGGRRIMRHRNSDREMDETFIVQCSKVILAVLVGAFAAKTLINLIHIYQWRRAINRWQREQEELAHGQDIS